MDNLEARCKKYIFSIFLTVKFGHAGLVMFLVSALTVETADNLEMHSKEKHQLSVNRAMTVVKIPELRKKHPSLIQIEFFIVPFSGFSKTLLL